MRRRGLAMVVVLLAVELLAAQGRDATRTDKEKLQGTWILAGMEAHGKPFPKDLLDKKGKIKLTFKGEKVIAEEPGRPAQEGTYTIDVSAKPKQIDLIPLNEGKDRARDCGIYELDGDTLKLAFGLPRDKEDKCDRPRGFGEKSIRPKGFGEKGSMTVTFKRVKS